MSPKGYDIFTTGWYSTADCLLPVDICLSCINCGAPHCGVMRPDLRDKLGVIRPQPIAAASLAGRFQSRSSFSATPPSHQARLMSVGRWRCVAVDATSIEVFVKTQLVTHPV